MSSRTAINTLAVPKLISQTPFTLLTGFLGSGKTTLLNSLLALKPVQERWALLINEFGQIGIDAGLIDAPNVNSSDVNSTDINSSTVNDTGPNRRSTNHKEVKIAIREVSGGCICCTSQLPLQIGLSRLLAEHHPQRLLIEPTGLAHPRTLLAQLSEPHWQTSLLLKSVICVLSGQQWSQGKYRHHEGYQAHVIYADFIAINRFEQLSVTEIEDLNLWLAKLNPAAKLLWLPAPDAITIAQSTLLKALDTNSQVRLRQPAQHSQKISLNPSLLPSHLKIDIGANRIAAFDSAKTNQLPDTLPYRYHNQQLGMMVGGWRLPNTWQWDLSELQDWLLSLPDWQRIKGILHTTQGWQRLNFTPDSLTVTQTSPQLDSRLEIILLARDNELAPDNGVEHLQQTWQQWDEKLIGLVSQVDTNSE